MKSNTSSFNLATRSNLLLHSLSYCASPLSNIFIWLKISPFTITTISNLTALLALVLLYKGIWPLLFGLLWVGALVFDISDGMVARRTGTTSANGSFYDHFSDQIKVAAVFLTAALAYNETALWISCWVACTSFLLMSIANEGLDNRSMRLKAGEALLAAQSSEGEEPSAHIAASSGSRLRSLLKRPLENLPFLRNLLNSFFVIQGNSMVWLVLLACGRDYALGVILWFAACCLYSMLFIVRAQITINRALAAAKISWK